MLQKSLTQVRWKSLVQPWQNLDWLLLVLPLGLTILGGVMIHSVEINQESANWAVQHLITGGVGLVLALAIARVRYEQLLQWHWIIYGITIVLLVAVKFFGVEGLGHSAGFQFWDSIYSLLSSPS